jgi:hypothetical protein
MSKIINMLFGIGLILFGIASILRTINKTLSERKK